MEWTNKYLKNNKNNDSEHFTTDFGIKVRKSIHPLMKSIIKVANDKKTILISYPKLDKGENFIFAAGHSFPGDIGSNLSCIDRSTYTLVGTTDQVDHNPQMNFLWANGIIYVNKLNPDSRKESFKKMSRILNSGTSVMLFPEGVLNNTENLNCVTLYPGFYHLAQENNKRVVPIVANYNVDDDVVFVAAGNPIDCSNKSKDEAKMELRDALATLRFNLSRVTLKQAKNLKRVVTPEEFLEFNPELNVELKRDSLTGDIHEQHLVSRKRIYKGVKWVEPNWDEEIMSYKEHDVTDFDDVYSFLDKVDPSKLSPEAYAILIDKIAEKEERDKYDMKDYMKKNWNK